NFLTNLIGHQFPQIHRLRPIHANSIKELYPLPFLREFSQVIPSQRKNVGNLVCSKSHVRYLEIWPLGTVPGFNALNLCPIRTGIKWFKGRAARSLSKI